MLSEIRTLTTERKWEGGAPVLGGDVIERLTLITTDNVRLDLSPKAMQELLNLLASAKLTAVLV